MKRDTNSGFVEQVTQKTAQINYRILNFEWASKTETVVEKNLTLKEICQLVVDDKLSEAFEALEKWINTEGVDSPLKNDVINLVSQYATLKKQKVMGVIEQKEVILDVNRIKNDFLLLFPKESKTNVVNKAQQLVKDGKIGEAIAVFKTWVDINGNAKLKNSLMLLKGQLAQVENDMQKGPISNEDAKLQKNRVVNSFSNLLNEKTNVDNSGYGEPTKGKVKKKK